LFAAFLAEQDPGTDSLTAVVRRHVEDYKPWLAARPGQNNPRLAPATIAHRLGTLRMFFIRIDEWGWDEAPPRVPMFGGDLPRLDRPLPRALDDAAAARLLRAAQDDRRMLVRVAVEVLLRTGIFSGGHNRTDRVLPGLWLVSGLPTRTGRATGVAHVWRGRSALPCRVVELGHEFAAGRARRGEVLVAFAELQPQVEDLLLEMG
jgi:hypothetical protein